ncbi:hypothetical protein HDF16_003727 [Granulicella aggregans]|uniref:BON domain-containing protein n=1 Tax=Granulicella aggregans TaxID=474949 RepID=A0A7W7ZFK5_9BACT|nr:BON domain-containing protein [Granulicella aggregans]MBB5059004.1 hypothetical protein [Granulicella aggregans]
MHDNEIVRLESRTSTAAIEDVWGYLAAIAVLAAALSVTGCKHSSAPAPQDDTSLTQAVQTKIAAESSLASEPIQASVRQGVATLTGTTSNDAARSLAANDAALVSGIRTVVNNLTVVSSQPAPAPQTASVAPPPPAPIKKEPRPERKPKPVLPAPPAQTYVAPEQAQIASPPPPAPIERATPSEPPAPPRVRSVTVPADTTIPVRLNQTLDSATTQEGDTFSGVLASDVLVEGNIVLPQGTAVSGRVDTVQEAAHFKGSSLLVIQLTSVHPRGANLAVSTDAYSKAGTGRGKNSAEKIGGGAAVGAVLGGIFGGGKGAAIGAAAGGGAGAGAQAITRGQQVQIPAESLVRFRLTSPVTVRLSGSQGPASDAELQRHN